MKRLVLLILLSLATGLAHADCDGPITPVTAKEKAFYNAQFPAMRNAIPRPPSGWQYKEDSKKELAPGYKDYIPTENCGPSIYYIGLSIGYERPMTQADSAAEMQAVQAAPDPAKQQKLQALQAQQMALMQQSIAAAQKQDYKTVDTLGKQSDALGKQMQALQADMNSGSQSKIAAIQWDREAGVHVSINDNSGDATCYGSPKAISVSGATAYTCQNPVTYSSPGEVLDPAKGHVIVVFGKAAVEQYDWTRKDANDKAVKDSYVQIKFDTNSDNSMAVHNVVVDVEGDDLARAQSLFSQMDLRPLAALVKH